MIIRAMDQSCVILECSAVCSRIRNLLSLKMNKPENSTRKGKGDSYGPRSKRPSKQMKAEEMHHVPDKNDAGVGKYKNVI